ncbi:hypothetical protein LTR96_006496 [Exophiala xenobiotica]|nr:hypothetical protein LTR92_005624 [Exophiala xenobiotica]KAK5267951.1 hypothetical protein LTR96_006496 [Exophiala xenobiotica]KAK5335687.1 hypothetical protein LTR98_007901 [Exophiala xenobiotica]KAK5360685.1 hypothetical protein LTS13_010248 [Exophiala xenobiotica]KAK5403865.1 hypothetical protein LTR79_000620 [Exophiala xenobiotica]
MYPSTSTPDHRSLIVNLVAALSLTSLLLANPVVAQQQQPDQTLVGCSSIPGCSSSTGGCTVGNATNAFLGATSFNATFPQKLSSSSSSSSASTGSDSDSVELTWTVGALSSSSSSAAANTLFTKNFYLGYPPSLALASSSSATDFAGCALFFEGIARSISLNGSEYGSMTCSQALGAQCVGDLLSQAKAQVQVQDGSTCASLQDAMQRNPPRSCWGIAMVTWGSVVAHDLTGPNAPVTPMTEGTCHPSIAGKGYNVALIESQTVRSEDVSSDPAPFFYSITPVISVFYTSGAGSGSESESEPKAYMSCLKVVDEDAAGSGSGGGGGVISTQTSSSGAPRSGVGPSNMSLGSLAWAMLGLGVVIRMSGGV